MAMVHKLVVVFSLLFLSAGTGSASRAASKEESLIGLTVEKYVIGVWPEYLKTVNKCLNFRLNSTPPLFVIWPEDDFHYCCEDRKTPHTIASYVHSELNGRFVHPIAYYDVGVVNNFMPFWLKSWLPDRISQKDITQLAYCEANDLKRFYVNRFWWEAIGKQGLLFSGLPFIFFVEFIVVLAIIIQYIRWPSTPVWKTLKKICGWETLWDLVHLCLLGINGNLLMEATGHWDPCGWEAVVLYNCGVFFTYLALLSVLSAMVQQIARWIAETTIERLRGDSNVSEHIAEDVGKLRKCKIEKEWQLQRISLQCAVLYVASLYCTFVTVFTRDEVVSWLLGIIIVAQVWSCVVAFGMLFKAYTLGHRCYEVVIKAREFQRATVHAISSP
jgi:hypothetical protein